MDLKKESLKVLAGICLVIALISVIRYFKLGVWQVIILLISFNLFLTVILQKFAFWKFIKNSARTAVVIWAIVYLSKYGIGGYIITCAAIVGLILYRRWEKYIEVKHHIEGMLWGKPLKEFYQEGKKPPKLKMVLKK